MNLDFSMSRRKRSRLGRGQANQIESLATSMISTKPSHNSGFQQGQNGRSGTSSSPSSTSSSSSAAAPQPSLGGQHGGQSQASTRPPPSKVFQKGGLNSRPPPKKPWKRPWKAQGNNTPSTTQDSRRQSQQCYHLHHPPHKRPWA